MEQKLANNRLLVELLVLKHLTARALEMDVPPVFPMLMGRVLHANSHHLVELLVTETIQLPVLEFERLLVEIAQPADQTRLARTSANLQKSPVDQLVTEMIHPPVPEFEQALVEIVAPVYPTQMAKLSANRLSHVELRVLKHLIVPVPEMAARLVYRTQMDKAQVVNNRLLVEPPVPKHLIVRGLEMDVQPVFQIPPVLAHHVKPHPLVDLPVPEMTNVLAPRIQPDKHVLIVGLEQMAKAVVSHLLPVTLPVQKMLIVMQETQRPKDVLLVFLEQMVNSSVRKILPVIQHVPRTLIVILVML